MKGTTNTVEPSSRRASRNERREAKLITHLPYWELDDGVLELRNRVLEVGIQLHLPDSDFLSDEMLVDLAETYAHVLRSVAPEGERARMVIETVTAGREHNPLPAYLESTSTPITLLRELAESRAAAIQHEFDAGFVRVTNIYVTLTLSAFKAGSLQPFFEDEWPNVILQAHDLRSRLLNSFTSIGIQAEVMDSQQMFALIWRYLNPGLHPAPHQATSHCANARSKPSRERPCRPSRNWRWTPCGRNCSRARSTTKTQRFCESVASTSPAFR